MLLGHDGITKILLGHYLEIKGLQFDTKIRSEKFGSNSKQMLQGIMFAVQVINLNVFNCCLFKSDLKYLLIENCIFETK